MEDEQEQFMVDGAENVASSAVASQEEPEPLPFDQDEESDMDVFDYEDFESLRNDSKSNTSTDDEDLRNDNKLKGINRRILRPRPRPIPSRYQTANDTAFLPRLTKQHILKSTTSFNNISDFARVVDHLARSFDTEAEKFVVPTNASKTVMNAKKQLVKKAPLKRRNQDELEPEDAAHQKKRSRKQNQKQQGSTKAQKRERARSRSHSNANKSAAKKQKKWISLNWHVICHCQKIRRSKHACLTKFSVELE